MFKIKGSDAVLQIVCGRTDDGRNQGDGSVRGSSGNEGRIYHILGIRERTKRK